MGTHLRVVSKSYPINTNMTVFKWFSKNLCILVFWMKVALPLDGLTSRFVVREYRKIGLFFFRFMRGHIRVTAPSSVRSLTVTRRSPQGTASRAIPGFIPAKNPINALMTHVIKPSKHQEICRSTSEHIQVSLSKDNNNNNKKILNSCQASTLTQNDTVPVGPVTPSICWSCKIFTGPTFFL